jgi:hypothetical protein
MRLLFETLGVLVAAFLLARFAFPSARGRYTAACLLVAAAVSAPLAFGTIDTRLRAMAASRKVVDEQKARRMSQQDIENQFGQRTGVNTDFTDWVLRRVPARDSYYLAMTPGAEGGGLAHWITWRMLPHVPTAIEGQRGDGIVNPPDRAAAAKAEWVVFYGLEPRRWALRDRVKLRLQRFAPKFWLGRRAA